MANRVRCQNDITKWQQATDPHTKQTGLNDTSLEH